MVADACMRPSDTSCHTQHPSSRLQQRRGRVRSSTGCCGCGLPATQRPGLRAAPTRLPQTRRLWTLPGPAGAAPGASWSSLCPGKAWYASSDPGHFFRRTAGSQMKGFSGAAFRVQALMWHHLLAFLSAVRPALRLAGGMRLSAAAACRSPCSGTHCPVNLGQPSAGRCAVCVTIPPAAAAFGPAIREYMLVAARC